MRCGRKAAARAAGQHGTFVKGMVPGQGRTPRKPPPPAPKAAKKGKRS